VDVYDELDRGLEYVQSMCEHAAHQFLRDGDCAEEVANIKRRLAETKELADKEMARVTSQGGGGSVSGEEGVDGVAGGGGVRGRSYRPQSMRRDGVKSPGSASASASASAAAAAAAASAAVIAAATEPLEVDEGVEDVDGGDAELPRLVYKSTRQMRA
jgi:hypothetical protein